MNRDETQSLLDQKFPKGANVAIIGGVVFNTARFLVMDDEYIECGAYDTSKSFLLQPVSVEEADDGTVVLVGASSGADVIVRPAPDIPELVEQRERVYTDELLKQMRA